MNTKQLAQQCDYKVDSAVKIQGTNYDRKRVVTKSMKNRMAKMYNSGKSYNFIAQHFGVAPQTVRYNLDEEYKAKVNSDRKNYARNWVPDSDTLHERAEYKRSLLSNKNSKRAVSVTL